MQQLKVAVVGAGYAGNLHLKRLLCNPRVSVVGVVDPDLQRCQAVAHEFNVSTFSSVDDLLVQSSLDASVICVPPHSRNGVEGQLADRGVALLIEKPLALSVVEGEELSARLARATRPVVVGYHWRFLAGLPSVRELLAQKKAHLALGHWLSSTPPASWWGDTATAGSQFIEQATHLIDLSLHLLGPVASVTGTGSMARLRDSATGFVKSAGATLAYENGCVGSFVTCCVSPDSYRQSLEIFVDDTAVVITEQGCTISSVAGSIQSSHQHSDLYEREQLAFLDVVEGISQVAGVSPGASIEEALMALRVAEAIERSIHEGRPIGIAERVERP